MNKRLIEYNRPLAEISDALMKCVCGESKRKETRE